MPRYFFDTRDDGQFIADEVGAELPDLEAAKRIAAQSLTELARDVVHTSTRRVLTVEVRDERQPVLEARLVFEAILLAETT